MITYICNIASFLSYFKTTTMEVELAQQRNKENKGERGEW
jgi:hypothetical protein